MRKLKKRIYYGFHLSLATPLCISNGEHEATDNDVIRNWDDVPFIPGTSFAGAVRTFAEECGLETKNIFGFTDENDGRQSSLWISDFYFDVDVPTTIRDGVHLKDKVAVSGAKYDYEVIENGSGILFMQLQIWDDDNEAALSESIQKIAGGIKNGDIRLGSQKNRGLGKLQLENVYCCEFSADNVEEWINFQKDDLLDEKYKVEIATWCLDSDRFVTIHIPLGLKGGLSIRQYSTKVNEPDFVSLMRKTTVNEEKPVIPGSTWKGALRQKMTEIMLELDLWQALKNEYIDILGYVDESKKKAKASEVVITESILQNSHYIRSVRNQISRFENATVQGALFEERCAVEGETLLEIKIKANDKYDWFIAILLLALKDLQKGYLAIGGATAIGRGIFEEKGQIIISSGKSEADYMKALQVKAKEVALT